MIKIYKTALLLAVDPHLVICFNVLNTRHPSTSIYRIYKHQESEQNTISVKEEIVLCPFFYIRIFCSVLYASSITTSTLFSKIIQSQLLPMFSNIIPSQLLPMLCALYKAKYNTQYCTENAIVDSLKSLLSRKHFNKPYFSDH